MTTDCKYRDLEREEIYKRRWYEIGNLTVLTPEPFIRPYLDLPTLLILTSQENEHKAVDRHHSRGRYLIRQAEKTGTLRDKR
jgi:hypothetical protein